MQVHSSRVVIEVIEDYMEPEETPLVNVTDTAILMHRDAHFGGSFEQMLDYYKRGGKGVNPEFELERIQELAEMEMQSKQNLASVLLAGADAEKVASARQTYKSLRDLYDVDKPFNKHPQLIADLILSEDEDPTEEIAAIVREKGTIVNALIEVIKSEEMHDPLFPGYGFAPSLAAKCLGEIGDKKGIIALFEALDSGDFFDEDVALQALRGIGKPAKDFLLRVVQGFPVTADNEKAALALIQFKDDPEVAEVALKLLKDNRVRKNPLLTTYLVLACEGLSDKALQKEFQALAKDATMPLAQRREMESILKTFGQPKPPVL